MDTFLAFLGLFISEGSTDNEKIAYNHGYRVVVSQKKEFNKEKIRSVFAAMPYNYSEDGDKFIIHNKQLWSYLRSNVGKDCYNIRIPRYFLNNCSSRQLNILLDYLMLGDGSVNVFNGQKTYYSVSKNLIDDVQELLILTGHSVIGIRGRKRNKDAVLRDHIIKKENMRVCYELCVSNSEAFYVKPNKITREHYKGNVYCCEVPNHVIMVRRNGKATWCGNSVGVTTINMPRLAYLSENEEDFYRRLENLMNICSRSLEIKRRVVTQLLQDGLYPYTKRYVKHFDNHFSTIATNGMNEMCLNAKWIKDTIASEKGYQFAKNVLDFMRNKLSDYQEQTGNLYNLESAPAESVCHRFALHDKRDFPDIITAGDNTDGAPYYTNSSNLPVGYTDDIFEALDHQDELQTKYTGGTVFHAFLGERLPNWKSAMMLTKKIAENYRLPYFTFSPTYSICKNHGYLVGEQWKCPHCGEPTEVYSRVTGYYRAVQNFNDGKAHEFKDRKEYKITEDSLKSNTAAGENDTVNTTQETQVYELDKPVLITTETCPNCKIVKEYIKEFDFDCDVIIANEHLDFVRSLNINQAPTLVVPDGDGNIRLIANASNIRKYLEENS